MIGWCIVVATKARQERVDDPAGEAAALASWEASVEGLDWFGRAYREPLPSASDDPACRPHIRISNLSAKG